MGSALGQRGDRPEGDAVASATPGVICGTLTADCAPVLLADPVAGVVAAAHAGWRGLAAGVLENTVRQMGVPPHRVRAWLGPAIGPQAFEVGDEVRAAFVAADPDAAAAFVARPVEGKWLADLFLLARRRLVAAGVIRMSVPKAVGYSVIHPHVADFLQQHPGIDVRLWLTDRTVDLVSEDIDLAIRITDTPPPGLAGRPLEAVEHIVCASPAYLARRGTPQHPGELAAHDCIYLGEDPSDRRWRFTQRVVPTKGKRKDPAGPKPLQDEEQATVSVHGRYVVNHSEMRREAAIAGLGIASLPGFAAQAALASGALVRVLAAWRHDTAYSGTAWLLYPPNRFLPSRVRAWVDHLASTLAAKTRIKARESARKGSLPEAASPQMEEPF